MITVTMEDLLVVEEGSCPPDILKEVVKESENIKIGIYKNGIIKRVMTYTDLFSGHEPLEGPLYHSNRIFEEARDIFLTDPDSTGGCIPVIDNDNNLKYVLCNEKNQIDEQNWVSDFSYYDIDSPYIDYELINRGDVFIFTQLEEYSYLIACIIERKFPQKNVFFMDASAALFFDGTSNVKILNDISEIFRNYRDLLNKSIFIIRSDKEFFHDGLRFIMKTYTTLEVMTSLFWACDRKSFGEKNPDKVFYLIKNPILNGGIADLVKFTLFRVEMVMHKPENYIPVIDLSIEEASNQFTRGNGDNTWLYFFEPISEIPLSEVYESKNVIISTNELELFNPYVQEWAYFADWNTLFRKYLRYNKKTGEYLEKLYFETIPDKKTKILGVIGRGTDYRSAKGRWVANPMDTELFLSEVEHKFKEWGYGHIFLATEDKEIFETFMSSSLSEHIIYVEQERIDYSRPENKDLFLTEIKMRDNVNGYEDGLRYLGILYILSKCDSLMSNANCGASNMAQGMKDGNYEYMLIY